MIRPSLGYYRVGTETFEDKTSALLYASTMKMDLEWVFCNDVFDRVDWTTEPTLDLDTFYRMRAQQIREQFDYVIIMCSGGGDSTNVIWSFLRNGIHVDEVIAGAPFSGLNNWQHQARDNTADNTISETVYAQLPLINDISQQYPRVRITLHDYFQNMLAYETDEWLLRSGDWIHPTSVARYDLESFPHIRDLAEAGKRVAIVYGIDKPNLLVTKENTLRMAMSDLAVNVQRPPFKKDYPNVENVLFYWTADMPEMLVKQAHVLARWIMLPENAATRRYMYDFNNPPPTMEANRIRQSIYERAIIPCIYPSTARKVFQGHKPTRMFLGEHDGWFYRLHNKTRMFEMIDSDFRNFIKNIDPSLLNKNRSGFKLYALSYDIGPVSKFIPSVMLDTD